MNYLPIFVVLTIITAPKPIVETKAIDNGLSVNESNNNQIASVNNNNNNRNNNNNSNMNAENIGSRETINQVRHQHRQQIGNVQIITEIDIKNLVTLLNSTSINAARVQIEPQQFTHNMVTADESNGTPIDLDRIPQFKRLDRHQHGDHKPFKFPEQSTMHSRHIRWPSDHHSNNAQDIVSKSNAISSPKLLIRFPNSELELENVFPTPENNVKPFKFTANDPNLTTIRPSSSTPNIFNNLDNNNENWIVNQTAIDNGLQPFIYIDDGIFKVKYIRKGDDNMMKIVLNADHNNSTSFMLINSVEESAIISSDEPFSTKSNNIKSPTTTTTMNVQTINNVSQPSNGSTTATIDTLLPFEEIEKPKQPQTQLNGYRKPRPIQLKDGLPIFV